MISVSRLLCGAAAFGDTLRYGQGNQSPVVVWNCTKSCNLHCVHCYADSQDKKYPAELTTLEAKSFIQDLADFGVPALLFSGGEPLLREDIFELGVFAKKHGIRPVLSTNGTLISAKVAQRIKEVGFGEVGISLDGIGDRNDRFRGQRGAYAAAAEGIRHCVAHDQKVSLRFTITRYNYEDIPAIFSLVEQENINRVCFYHLVYAGRGSKIKYADLTPQETRAVVDLIGNKTVDLHRRGRSVEVLTVDNHADGVYFYLEVDREQPQRGQEILALLRRNGGNSSGVRIGAVDNLGDVHPDQFWGHYSLGNVRERKFSDIWLDTSDALMRGLKDRRALLKGRCARCRYLDLCNGNLRVRAEAVYGDVWASDPACYLSDEEIGLME